MKIEKLWVVVRPSRLAELGDVCFETDAAGLALQFKGGLDPEGIHALYTAATRRSGRESASWPPSSSTTPRSGG